MFDIHKTTTISQESKQVILSVIELLAEHVNSLKQIDKLWNDVLVRNKNVYDDIETKSQTLKSTAIDSDANYIQYQTFQIYLKAIDAELASSKNEKKLVENKLIAMRRTLKLLEETYEKLTAEQALNADFSLKN